MKDSSGAGEEAAAADRDAHAWGKVGCTEGWGKREQRAEGAEMKNTRQFLGCSMPLKLKEVERSPLCPQETAFCLLFSSIKVDF